jgi:hypothetical protein
MERSDARVRQQQEDRPENEQDRQPRRDAVPADDRPYLPIDRPRGVVPEGAQREQPDERVGDEPRDGGEREDERPSGDPCAVERRLEADHLDGDYDDRGETSGAHWRRPGRRSAATSFRRRSRARPARGTPITGEETKCVTRVLWNMGFGSYDESEQQQQEVNTDSEEEGVDVHQNTHEGEVEFETGSTDDLLDHLEDIKEEQEEAEEE